MVYSWESADGNSISSGNLLRRCQRFLVESFGVDNFCTVIRVELGASGSDADLELIAQLSQLEELQIFVSTVSDSGLAKLKGLSKLRRFVIGWAPALPTRFSLFRSTDQPRGTRNSRHEGH